MAAVAALQYCFEPEAGDFSEFCCREFDVDVYQRLVASGMCRIAVSDQTTEAPLEKRKKEAEKSAEGTRRSCSRGRPTLAQQTRAAVGARRSRSRATCASA